MYRAIYIYLTVICYAVQRNAYTQETTRVALLNFLNFFFAWYAKIFHIAIPQRTNALHYDRKS